jgi:hypothetical protein
MARALERLEHVVPPLGLRVLRISNFAPAVLRVNARAALRDDAFDVSLAVPNLTPVRYQQKRGKRNRLGVAFSLRTVS